jgi:hypothetical protein
MSNLTADQQRQEAKRVIGTYFLDFKHPKSEKTLQNHNYTYKGLHYINDLGRPCEYRVEQYGKDLGIMVKYYGGSLLGEFHYSKKPETIVYSTK